MAINRISAVIGKEERDAIMTAITTIREKLPFLIDLTPEEKMALPKMGDKSRAFVAKATEVAAQNPGFLPRDFDLAELKKDADLFEALYPIRQALTQLAELVDDSCTAAGSEAYMAALLVYSYAKSSPAGTAGLDGVMDELGMRFARKAKTAKQPKPSAQ
jgi:hypothetical protein